MSERDRNKEAVGILRGVLDRVGALEQAVSPDAGVPNLLRRVADRSTSTDVATTSTSGSPDATDRSTSADTASGESSATPDATDQSTSADTASASTGDSGGWTWDSSQYDFDEWS